MLWEGSVSPPPARMEFISCVVILEILLARWRSFAPWVWGGDEWGVYWNVLD